MFKKIFLVIVIFSIFLGMLIFFEMNGSRRQEGRSERTTESQKQQSIDQQNQQAAQQQNQVYTQEERGESYLKKYAGRFILAYPDDWHWVDANIQHDGFVTNSDDITYPWMNNPRAEMDDDDIVLTAVSAPLDASAGSIAESIEQLEHEIIKNNELDAEKYSNTSCAKNQASQFDVEYDCYYEKDGLHYRKIAFGIINKDSQFDPSKHFVVALSKDADLIEKFSVRRSD